MEFNRISLDDLDFVQNGLVFGLTCTLGNTLEETYINIFVNYLHIDCIN